MTRAEAIKILINYGENNIIARTKVGIAFDMAIKSLETDEAYQLEYERTTKNDLGVDCISRADAIRVASGYCHPSNVAKELAKLPSVTPQEPRWIPCSEKYEHHIDHTDCIWYGNDNGCPVTCSQYRDGWNDAMDYIFKNGDGYRPYRRNENG